MKRLTLLLALLATLGFVIAGCGDEEGSGGSDAAGTMATTATQDDDATDEGTTAEIDASVPRTLDEAVERCKQGATASPQLSQETKDALVEVCEEAGDGDEESAREASKKVCELILEETVPEGTPGREQGLEACKNAGER